MITAEPAMVYRGGGRRWFTKRAACHAAARAKIKTRCECSKGGRYGQYDTPDDLCWYHENMDRFHKIVRRMSRIYEQEFAKDKP